MLRIKSLLILVLILSSGFGFAQDKKIAYCSDQTSSGLLQIFIMNEDGSDKKQLTDINENCMKPKWSPDGKQIVFYTNKGLVYLIRDIDSTSSDPFYVWSGYNPSFMPGGDEIMFNSEYDDVLSIFAIDTAKYETEPQLISDGGYSNMQVLSHDGNKVVFSAFDNDTKVIVIADLLDTTDNYITKVSKNNEANLEPDISSDDEKVVYASFDNNLKGTIRILQGGIEAPLTKGMPSSNVPRFSPDGNRIAFVVINNTNVSLYVMNDDGSSKRDLNVRGGSVGTFQWLDNENIVYDAGSESRTSIGIINVDTGANEIIAEGGFNLQPSVMR